MAKKQTSTMMRLLIIILTVLLVVSGCSFREDDKLTDDSPVVNDGVEPGPDLEDPKKEISYIDINEIPNSASSTLRGETPFLESYLVGDVLNVPVNKFTIDGVDHETTASVKLPNGDVVRNGIITLSYPGKYAVTYIAEVDGKYYGERFEFLALNEAVSGGVSLKNPETGYLDISLSNMEVMTYNVPINLSSMTKEDELISVIVNASQTGVRDFQEYIIVLTDAYDSNNSVYIRVKAEVNFSTNPQDPQYYSRYQAFVGVDFHDRNQFVGCEKDKIHRANIYGTPIHNSFCNMSKADTITRDMDALSLRWDNAEKAFYVTSPGFYGSPTIVADLDNPTHFNTDWNGFHNDTVYLSIYAKEVVGSAKLSIKHIGGQEIVTGTINDDTPPSLTVDYGEYDENSIPNAVVGNPYKIFDAETEDIHMLSSTVKHTVYFNYSGNNARMVEIVDGCFTPEYSGTYTIVYTAGDDFGNKTEKLLHVNAVRSEKIDFSVSDSSAKASELVSIPAPILTETGANTGKYTLKIEASNADFCDIIYEGALEDYKGISYRFMSEGIWNVVYTIGDYSRATSNVAKYSIASGDNAIIDSFDDLLIDRAFISGNPYILPEVTVFSSEKSESSYPASVKVICENGSEIVLESNVFVPDAKTMGKTVTIVYYDKNNESIKISGEKIVYDIGENGTLKLENLFVSNNAQITAQEGNMIMSASSDAVIDMIAKQYAEEFVMKFNLFADAGAGNSFGSFDIILTDSVDSSISVKITIKNTLGAQNSSGKVYNSALYINDNEKNLIELQQKFSDAYSALYNITLNNALQSVLIEGKSLDIDECLDGSLFEGFPSKAVYISFKMNSVKGEGIAEIYSINSQTYTNYTEDNIKPYVIVNGSYLNSYEFGNVIDIASAYGIDAICGYSDATVTVRSLDGAVVKTLDGVEVKNLDARNKYQIKLTEYGEYIVQYATVDANGNTSVAAKYIFAVEDKEKPVIDIKGELQKYAFAGDKLELPKIELTDNVSKNLKLYVVVITPDGVYQKVDPSDFTFAQKGTYTVILSTMDGDGNMTSISYYVEVVNYEK